MGFYRRQNRTYCEIYATKGGLRKMKFIDFFSGIGGFRLGMEMAGHECVGHCEYDKFAEKSYRAMHDTKEDEWYAKDIREVRAKDVPRADVWCFGFPCQDISVAGKQRGFEGERSSLFFTVTNLIRWTKKENRPRYLLIENVKNFFSVNGGWDFLKAQIELDEIGYDVEWQLLNSKDFGVPQNRERVFIVGHLRGRSRREVFPITQSDGIYNEQGQNKETNNENSLCLTAKGQTNWTGSFIKVVGCLDRPKYHESSNRVYGIDGISPCQNTNQGGGHETKIAIPVLTPDRLEKRQNGRRFKTDGEPIFTLTGQDRHGVSNGTRIRKLTPRECFRLQGWTDEYFDRAAEVNSDSQLYKQAGNGVTVTVIYEIAKKF